MKMKKKYIRVCGSQEAGLYLSSRALTGLKFMKFSTSSAYRENGIKSLNGCSLIYNEVHPDKLSTSWKHLKLTMCWMYQSFPHHSSATPHSTGYLVIHGADWLSSVWPAGTILVTHTIMCHTFLVFHGDNDLWHHTLVSNKFFKYVASKTKRTNTKWHIESIR